ncbi:unnamed protein product [Leptidea sinapis]|uniref:Uncharacterized protein n=1 Tax=Leptidea sinapis TaxID=189913 RepID=A0A5E4Q7S0_9NEOP|nr:unnamed protein product [Leptidea sinapis]
MQIGGQFRQESGMNLFAKDVKSSMYLLRCMDLLLMRWGVHKTVVADDAMILQPAHHLHSLTDAP